MGYHDKEKEIQKLVQRVKCLEDKVVDLEETAMEKFNNSKIKNPIITSWNKQTNWLKTLKWRMLSFYKGKVL